MTGILPCPAELLRGRSSGSASISSDVNGVVHKLLDLADRGDYLEAAAAAAELLLGPTNDVRLITIYLAGLFVERGAPVLPELLAWMEKWGNDDSRALDSALEWLLRALTDRVAFHTSQRDDTWQSWLRDLAPAQVEEMATRCETLRARFPKRGAALQKLGRWARDKLLPAVVRARRAAPLEPVEPVSQPQPEPEPGWHAGDRKTGDGDDADEEEAPDSDDELEARSARPTGSRAVDIDSPALAGLRAKLRAFEVVLARGELEKAAVVAHDVQAILGDFDPLVYLPGLFSRYAELLHLALPEIEARWSDTDSAQWRILVQFYRTNLVRFVDG